MKRTLPTIALSAVLLLAPATAANAQDYRPRTPDAACGTFIVNDNISAVRKAYPQTRSMARSRLVDAGRTAVRYRHERVWFQLGVVRTRIYDSIGRDVARQYGVPYGAGRLMGTGFPSCFSER